MDVNRWSAANADRHSMTQCEDVLSTPTAHSYDATTSTYCASTRGTTVGGRSSASYTRLVRLYARSTGTYDFARNLQLSAAHSGNPWCWIACFYFLGIIPLGLIIFGAVNLYNCRGEPMIPVHMVVNGVALLLLDNLIIWERWPRPRRHLQRMQMERMGNGTGTATGHDRQTVDAEHSMRAGVILRRLLGAVLKTFILVWAVAGVVWVYASRRHIELDAPGQSELSCSPVLYWVAYAVLSVELGCIALCAIIVAVFLVFVALTRGTHTDDNDALDDQC